MEAASEMYHWRVKERTKTYGDLLTGNVAAVDFSSYLGKSFHASVASSQMSLKNHLEFHEAPIAFKHIVV